MFLHQTTTIATLIQHIKRCILSCSYIKPQQAQTRTPQTHVVYYHVPTSNHNFRQLLFCCFFVVYYHVPTSNHNIRSNILLHSELYIIMFLHQTTTCQSFIVSIVTLYIIMFLHQTTTCGNPWYRRGRLYIIMFLHQTTTAQIHNLNQQSCILSCSYIKPQPIVSKLLKINKKQSISLIRNGCVGNIFMQIY